jgi:enterobactin synthetase component D
MVDTLFPKEVLTGCSEEEPDLALLHPDEAECVRNAVPKRKREFAKGRLCARRLLAEMGIRQFPLLVGQDRSPVWPEGIAGSLSHCDGYCAVALARKSVVSGIGLDVETAARLDDNLVPMVCTAEEIAWLSTLDESDRGRCGKLLFSAKESVFKCVYPLTGLFLDFQDCRIRLQPGSGTFAAALTNPQLPPRWLERELPGRFAVDSRRVFTGLILPAGN